MAWLNVLAFLVGVCVWASGLVAEGSRRRVPSLVILGLLVLAAEVLWSAGLAIDRWHLTPEQLGTVPGGFILGTWLWADVIGLPRRLAVRFGIGLREPRLDFNNLIERLGGQFLAAVKRCGTDPQRCGRHLATARSLVDRLEASQAPDSDWDACRRDTVACHRRLLAVVDAAMAERSGEETEPGSDLEAAYKRVTARRMDLCQAATDDLGISAVEHRRGFILSGSATGLSSVILVWGGVVLASHVRLPVSTDPWLWLEACVVGLGLWVALYAGGWLIEKATRSRAGKRSPSLK